MSKTSLPIRLKNLLVFRAGGRCEFDGCNKDLSVDGVTKLKFNAKQFAHIIADSPKGPRGCADSEKYNEDINNIMLLCPEHHKLIDENVDKFSVEFLNAMKKKHEDRVRRLLNFKDAKERTIVIYHANIGSHVVTIPYESTIDAMWPDAYPSSEHVEIGLNNSFMTENEENFWKRESEYLERLVKQKVIERIDDKSMIKFALFALAPMPLLVRLGTLLPSMYDVKVYQKHREPDTWKWSRDQAPEEFELKYPENLSGEACLVFSISANICERVKRQFPNASIWEITVPNPRLDYLQTENQLSAFRQITRMAFMEIKDAGKQDVKIFMAMPNACAVEVGRVWMPKADIPMLLYDYNKSISEDDRYAFAINNF